MAKRNEHGALVGDYYKFPIEGKKIQAEIYITQYNDKRYSWYSYTSKSEWASCYPTEHDKKSYLNWQDALLVSAEYLSEKEDKLDDKKFNKILLPFIQRFLVAESPEDAGMEYVEEKESIQEETHNDTSDEVEEKQEDISKPRRVTESSDWSRLYNYREKELTHKKEFIKIQVGYLDKWTYRIVGNNGKLAYTRPEKLEMYETINEAIMEAVTTAYRITEKSKTIPMKEALIEMGKFYRWWWVINEYLSYKRKVEKKTDARVAPVSVHYEVKEVDLPEHVAYIWDTVRVKPSLQNIPNIPTGEHIVSQIKGTKVYDDLTVYQYKFEDTWEKRHLARSFDLVV